MLILLGFILSFIILAFVVLKGIYIGYGILLSFIIFVMLSFQMGSSFKEIIETAWAGGKKALVVLRMFTLIGLVTASWLIAGTIPSIVYHSLNLMHPKFFILFAFLITSMVGYMLGTSLGTASTMGIVLIIMARGGDINLNIAAGAILSGCYFGDRTSPMSSSAALVAGQTDNEIYPMLKSFRRTTYIPFLFVSFIYLVLSFSNPLDNINSSILTEINNCFNTSHITMLPAFVMLTLSVLKINVRKSMVASIITGVIIAITMQKASIGSVLKALFFGFSLEPDNPLVDVIKGGGLISMLQAAFVVSVSCAMAGLFEGMDLFKKAAELFKGANSRAGILLATAGTSFVSACFGGNQSIAIVMASEIMRNVYKKKGFTGYELAVDLSNTAILFAAAIPWNIAGLIPATTWGVYLPEIVPFAFYLFVPFIYNYLTAVWFYRGEVTKMTKGDMH